ncbi:MAG: hypothetical protein H0U03_12585 [Actinobacteria bacterium]|nr:hypothetical protein [Actinomycetota bacterium]
MIGGRDALVCRSAFNHRGILRPSAKPTTVGAMRAMFIAYLLLTFAGIAFYLIVGLTHN